jgi:hypothetical protein
LPSIRQQSRKNLISPRENPDFSKVKDLKRKEPGVVSGLGK